MSILHISNSTALGKAIRLPLRLIPRSTVLRVSRGITSGLRWRVGSGTHGCWLGTYEWEKQEVVRALVKPGMKVFDIGANAGFYTLGFARLCAEAGHVWAFEPLAENVVSLMDHVSMNRLHNVTVVQAAVSSAPGLVAFQLGVNRSMGSVTAAGGNYMVATVGLDRLIEEGALPVPDLVKMDVEGAESLVLEGAKELLARRSTTWLIALHGEEQTNVCRRLLSELGYETRQIGGPDEIISVPTP